MTQQWDEGFEVYMIHWDSQGTTTGTGTGTGTVTFPPGYRVIALITGYVALDSSDSWLGHPDVTYPFELEWRGTSETVAGAGPDPILVSPDRRTVDVSFTTTLATDQARVLVAIPGPVMTGDANLDGVVDDADLSLLLANWGIDVTPEPDYGWSRGDFNGEAPVDDADLSLLLAGWSKGGGGVPEPATLSLLAFGATVLVRQKHRR